VRLGLGAVKRSLNAEFGRLGKSSHDISAAGGMKLIARSVSAVMVRLGFTPRLAETTDPSQMYIFL
jgi:hypothetical protein